MVAQEAVEVVGREGLRARAARGPWIEGGADEVTLTLEDGRRVAVPADLLRPRGDGSYEMSLAPADLEALGGEAETIPLAREELRVDKRQVPTGKVVVHKTVQEREEVVDMLLGRHEVDVERVPVNRYVDEAAPIRQEGDTTIVPVHEEVLVVEKRLVLREEVRINRRYREDRYTDRVPLRSEHASIDHQPSEENADPRRPQADPTLDKDDPNAR